MSAPNRIMTYIWVGSKVNEEIDCVLVDASGPPNAMLLFVSLDTLKLEVLGPTAC